MTAGFNKFRDLFLAEHNLSLVQLTELLMDADKGSEIGEEWRKNVRQNTEHWCYHCKRRHLPTAEHPSCNLCDALHTPMPTDIFFDYRGWKFTPPFICMGCGIEVCFHQWAFSRSCGPCDVSDSHTRRLLYGRCFAGPHEQTGKESDGGFIPADDFVDPKDRDRYPVMRRAPEKKPPRPKRKPLGFDSLYDALKMLYSCFDDEGSLCERYPDQLSVALEKAENALACADEELRR